MTFWLEFFKDKRFAWDFKIANFVMRDVLRNYLVINSAILERVAKSTNLTDFQKGRINSVVNNLNTLMEGI